MKKMLALILVFAMILSATVALADPMKVGELTYLNSDSVTRTELMEKVLEVAKQNGAGALFGDAEGLEMVEFDTLNSMQMALDAGQIDAMILYMSVGSYLDMTTGKYNVAFSNRSIDAEKVENDYSNPAMAFTVLVSDAMLGTDFSLMVLEENAALRDEINQALASMKEDGSLLSVMTDNGLLGLIFKTADGEPAAVEMPDIKGAETIKVAVTGDLPPLDYVDAAGHPAGFNTALLAEISKRIGKNIELVSIDAASRAIALTSGNVDAVFWARVGSANLEAYGIDVEALPEDMKAALEAVTATGEALRDKNGDIPEGTILTTPYMHDMYVLVFPKK